MTNVKRFISIMISSVMLLTILAACGGNNTNNGGSNGEGGAAKLPKISLFQSKVEIADQLEAMAKKYKEETGNEIDVWGSAGDNYLTQLQAKLNAGEGPTIFGVQTGAETTKFQSYYYDMSNESYVKNIAPNMEVKIDDKIIGVPTGVEGFGFVYNKELVDPAKITDLATFKTFLEESKSNGINGFSLSQEAYFLIGHIINTPFALQQDPVAFIEQLNKGEVKMADTKEFQEFGQYMEAIRESSKNPLEVTYDTQMGDFATGKTAIVHQGNWSHGMLADYQDVEVGMMPMPLAGNTKLAVDIPAIWVINNKASADQIKAANAFFEWLYNSETGKNIIVNEFKFIPAMTNIETSSLDPLSQAVSEATVSGNTIPWALTYFPQGIIQNDLAPVAQEFFLNKSMTGAQLLQKLDEVWAKAPKQ
ncbi:ABC transporter substrate-binding protein [Paenibacillus sp. 1011MAR3C5]|uniref:ABC transporter substrate-binding protein n=1 Tax=Paenibacillus sp. 1011MAR3C5 TaxID=1675787 RepID=UPI000E6B9AEC|nr:ABC transporter substrate-binding protein [Paenibacillus sp. 1011MAR3C5]RJE88303.1 ABC transporter substrate-binding protein [Paenibacillus sp. 1011MAR3C5]